MPRKPKQEKHKGVFERVKGSGVWWIRYTDERGKRVTNRVGTFAAAARYVDQRTTEIRLGISVPKRGVRFGDLLDDAIAFSKKYHRASNDFEQRVELARERFGSRVSDSITTRELQVWIDAIAEGRRWTAGTKNRVRSSLSTVFREAMRDGKASNNPAKLLRRFKEPMGRVRFLSEKEEAALREAILAELPGRIRYIKAGDESIRDDGESALAQLDVALHTGMRRGEQFTVTWPQIDLERGFIYLSMTKNGNDRYVHLNQTALRVLRTLKEKHARLGLPEDSTLFHTKRGELIKNPRKWFTTACELAGLDGVTWHTLRHTFASRLVMAGVDLRTVQELLGHKTMAMTTRYAHLAPTHKLQALETLVNRYPVLAQSGRKMATSTQKVV